MSDRMTMLIFEFPEASRPAWEEIGRLRKRNDELEEALRGLLRDHEAFTAAIEAMNKEGVSTEEILRMARERWQDYEPLVRARRALDQQNTEPPPPEKRA